MNIRLATSQDIPEILRLLHLKAEFDGCPGSVSATAERLRATLFSDRPMAYILLVLRQGDTSAVGFASYHFTYSTFLAKPSIWLDDLYLEPDCRNQSIGTRLIERLCKVAAQHDCGRIDWTVDVNNESGIRFYQRMGARLQKGLYLCQMNQEGISQVCERASVERSE
ncbi:MAG: GNAT family N-acetyltransferase [Cyanobacteria bacterium J06627_28]